jgi:lysophospholipase L1-like esterase
MHSQQFMSVRSRPTWVISLCAFLLLLSACAGGAGAQSSNTVLRVQQEPKARLTYVAVGASDTYGTGADDPQSESWPSDLTRSLGRSVRLINLGIPGVHADEALNIELPVAIDAHPNVVTVWLAVNDLADNVPSDTYSRNLDLLLTRLQAGAPHARIAVANVPDISLLPRFRSSNQQVLRERISTYNTIISDIVARHHMILVDLYQSWQELASHPEYISSDGFHPNAIGYTRVAEIFYQVLHRNGL